MMGSGIAYAQASRGVATVLRDVSMEKAQAGRDHARKLTDARVRQGRMRPQEQEQLLARITPVDSAQALQGCNLIIEAVFENRDLKARVTQEAETMLAPGGFFASNTSTLPIGGLAKARSAPERFVGIHFFSPVDKMKLVEIIRGEQTSDETVARAFDYVQAIGKIPIVVNDSRGFFTSRVFGTFVMEGAAMLGEGIPAPVVEHAGIMAGMPVGPLAVLDETALSLSVHVLDQTRADYRAEGGTVRGQLDIARYITTPKGEIAGRVLLVDDLADSGHTLHAVVDLLRNNYPPITELRTAVIWTKGMSKFTADYSVEFLPTNPWIHQPFEVYDSMGPEKLLAKWKV
jgi:3-hydroxyacyl-CoA dehydrogenase/enoyl-CoA hydratase/3-hydroxybutyryl-CoA epimerase